MPRESSAPNVSCPRRVALGVVFMLALTACSGDGEPQRDISQIEQEVHGICELLPHQMKFCAFPGLDGFGCHCDRQLCLEVMEHCQETDPSWWQHCFQACPVTVVDPPPPFDPASDCEDLQEQYSLPHWHICNYPRCWDLEPGETCIVPYGGPGGFES